MCYGHIVSSQSEFLSLLIGLNNFRLIVLVIGDIDLFYLTENIHVTYSLYVPFFVQAY